MQLKTLTLALSILLVTTPVIASETLAPPIVQLSASAKTALINDELSARIRIENISESPDAGNRFVNERLNQAMTALKAAGITLTDRTTSQYYHNGPMKTFKQKWVTVGEVTATASSVQGIQLLSAKLSQLSEKYPDTFQVNTRFSISEKLMTSVKDSLLKSAATNFNTEALKVANALGYAKYVIKEVNYDSNPFTPRSGVMYAMKASGSGDTQPEPVESSAEASLTFSGQIYLLK